jgi:class 3 adenylate cyclase
MLRNAALALALLLWCLTPALADPLTLTEEAQDLGSFLYLKDPSDGLTYSAIQAMPNSAFEVFSGQALNLGFYHSPVWIRFELENPTLRDEWILLYDYPRTDSIDLYIETAGGLTEFHTGDHFAFSKRPLPHQAFAFPFRLEQGKRAVIHARFKTEGTLQIPIRITTPAHFADSGARETAFLCLIYGIMTAMMCYNAFLFFSVRDWSYFYYVFYIATSILLQTAFNGMADRYLWGEFIWWSDRSFAFLTIANVMFAVLFSRRFLQLGKVRPVLNAISLVFVLACVLSLAAGSFIRLALLTRIGAVLALTGLGAILASAIILTVRGHRPARFFLVAWVVFLLGAIVYGLQKLGFVQRGFFSEYTYQIGTAVEVILLSLALGDRINYLQSKIIAAQSEAVEAQSRLARSFERFVPKQFLQFLGRSSIEDIQLGDAVERRMTILFSDIRSFTSLSEKMTPEENFRFLNSYLKRMGPIIRRNNGFIDKYIGDAVMSLFPEEPEQAVKAAIEMQAEIREYNKHRMRQGYDPVNVGIGIHTGALMLGTIGEQERLEGTVISDSVNLASRIEGLTKEYDAAILISQDTLFQLPDPGAYKFRVLDQVQVKGKQEKVSVVEILDGRSEYLLELFEKTRVDFDKGISLFLSGDNRAASHFRNVLAVNPADRAAQIYLARTEAADAGGARM